MMRTLLLIGLVGLCGCSKNRLSLEERIRNQRKMFYSDGRKPSFQKKVDSTLSLFERDAQHKPRIVFASMYAQRIGLEVSWIADGPVVAGVAFKPKQGNPVLTSHFQDSDSINQDAGNIVFFRSSAPVPDIGALEEPFALALIDKDNNIVSDYAIVEIINPVAEAQQDSPAGAGQ